MNVIKGQWIVKAGILPGEPMDEYNMLITYTGQMYEEDKNGATHFQDSLEQIYDFAKNITNPGMVNWVDVKFVWL